MQNRLEGKSISDEWLLTPNDYVARDAGYYIDLDVESRLKKFFSRKIRHYQGPLAGRSYTPSPWMWNQYIRPLFCWMRPNGKRRFREAFLGIPKKNGKSITLSALSLWLLAYDGEMGAEVYSVANGIKQAKIIFNGSLNMIKQDQALAEALIPQEYYNKILYPTTLSKYEVLSGTTDGKHGFNASAICYDELHEKNSAKLYYILKQAGLARRNPLFLSISTAGQDEAGLCYDLYNKSKRIQTHKDEELSFLGVAYGLDPDDDPHDPKTWYKCNPNLGISIDFDSFRDEYLAAKRTPEGFDNWLILALNKFGKVATGWLDKNLWSACSELVSISDIIQKGLPAYIGMDLSSSRDLACFVVVARLPTGKIGIVPYFFMPSDRVKQKTAKSDINLIDYWCRRGLITETPGNSIHFPIILDTIKQLVNAGLRVEHLGYDPWNAVEIGQNLVDMGLKLCPVGQSMKYLSPVMKYLERLILAGNIAHGGHPVLSWNFENVVVGRDRNNNIAPLKNASKDPMDGISAILDALYVFTKYPVSSGEVYVSVVG